jgi:hypothetical protein
MNNYIRRSENVFSITKSRIRNYFNLTRNHINKYAAIFSATIACLIIAIPSTTSAAMYSQVIYSPADPPAGYLATPNNAGGLAWMLDNAISSDLSVSTAGDYCNYYNTSGPNSMVYQNNLSQSSVTGFSPSSPLYYWQEGDQNNNSVCQAEQGTWGFKINNPEGNDCTTAGKVCGMQHFARFSGTYYPWSSYGTAPEPALTFSVNVKPQTDNYASGTDGYFCPILKDSYSGNYIEYCFVNWQTGGGYPNISQFDQIGMNGCGTTSGGQNVATIYTAFGPDLTWSTERAGSANTFGNIPNNVTQTASITGPNLLNAINQIDNSPPIPNGCGWNLSKNVANYQVIGFEDGMEGGGYSTLGESVSNENMSITTDSLFAGDTLQSGSTMYSSNYVAGSSGYRITMQTDGNLVVYNYANSALWQSHTSTPGSYAVMQTDGNLVVYNPSNIAQWSSGTSNAGSYAIMQPDGNFVIYKGNVYQWQSGS